MQADQGPGSADAPSALQVPGECVDLARDVFSAIEKTLKVRRLYESGHKLRRESREELGRRFEVALETLGEITVEIRPESLDFEGHPVLREERREGSVPFKLFRDGVRSLTVRRGFSAEEVRKLLVVLETQPEGAGHVDEDMATLLWRQDFRHLEYVAVDEIGGSGGAGKDGEGGGPLAEMGRRVDELIGAITTLDPPDWSDGSGARRVADRKDVFEMERRALATGEETAEEASLDLPLEVVLRLRADLEAQDVGVLVHRVVDILFDLFGEEECALRPEDVRTLLGQFLGIELGKGDLSALNRVLDRLLRRRIEQPEGPVAGLVDGLLQDLASEAAMQTLGSVVSKGIAGSADELSRYLLRLPAEALRFLALQARDLAAGPERETYHRVLRSRGRESPEALVLFLRDGPPEDIVEALQSLIDADEAQGAAVVVADLLSHPDARVRVESIRVLETLESSERSELLGRGLVDPSLRVRQAALRIVERTKERSLLGLLVSRIDDGEAEEEEWVRLIHAVAVLGGPGAVDCLGRNLGVRRRSWFVSKKVLAARRAAILSLRDVTDEAVRAFLAEGQVAKDRAFADACRSVLALARAEKGRSR